MHIIVGIIGTAIVVPLSFILGSLNWDYAFNPENEPQVGALSILKPAQGGTGLGSATAGQVGKIIKVLDDDPFTYELADDATGGGGGTGSNWNVSGGTGWLYPSTTIGIIVNASSTFNATTSAAALRLFQSANVSASESVGGVLNINRSTALGPAIVAYNNSTTGGGRLGSFVCDATGYDTQCLHVRSDSTLETTLNVLGSPEGKGIVKVGSNGVGDADASGIAVDVNLASSIMQGLYLNCNSTNTRCVNFRIATAEVFTIDNTGLLTFGNASSTRLSASYASSTLYYGANLADCNTGNMLTWTAGRFGCEDDTSGGGGGNSKWATSTDNAIYPNGVTNSVVLGRSTQFEKDCLLCVSATSTMQGTSGALIYASTSPNFDGTVYEFYNAFSGSNFYVNNDANIYTTGGATLSTTLDVLGHSSLLTASTTMLTLGNAGSNIGIFFTQDGDGALTVQGIGNANNESFTLNLDDTADVGVYSSATGLVAFDYPNIRNRMDGLVIDGDATFPASSDGSLIIGDGTDGGTFEMEDGPACIGDGGCTPNAQDGSLLVSTMLGVGTTTPWSALSLGTGFGSSTMAITVAEHRVGTSTAISLDWRNGNTQTIRHGNAATTITHANYTDGAQLKVIVCNPTGAGGALTWATTPAAQILWPGGVVPSQTTTANKCDVWSFIATQATSSLKIFGAMTANF